MRHRVYGKKLAVDRDHRRALLRNLAAAFIEHGQIETTLPRAHAVQPLVERIITIAKRGTFDARRRIESILNDRHVHVFVADPNVPDAAKENSFFDLPPAEDVEFNRYGEVRRAPRLVQHIIKTVGPMFADRTGGYTRVIRTGRHRLGDGADTVILQMVGREEGPQIGGGASRRRAIADKRTAFAAKVRKSGKKDAGQAEPAVAGEKAE
jgi:large subunit ribosomal protein L17